MVKVIVMGSTETPMRDSIVTYQVSPRDGVYLKVKNIMLNAI